MKEHANKRSVLLLVAVSATAIALTAPLQGSAALHRSAAGSITIGSLGTQTGIIAASCYDGDRGVAVALNEAKQLKESVTVKEGGRTVTKTLPYLRGVQVSLNAQDDQATAAAAVTGYRAIADSNAVAMVGPCNSTAESAILPLIDPGGIPQVISFAAASTYVYPKFAFRGVIPEAYYAHAAVQVLKSRGVKSVYLISDFTNPTVVEDVTYGWIKALKALKINILDNYLVSRTTVDFTPAIKAIRDGHPDAVGVALGGNQSAIFATALRNAGLNTPLFGGKVLYKDDFFKLGAAVAGTVIGTPYSDVAPYPSSQRFGRLFKQMYPGLVPTPIAAGGYDATWRVLRAIHDAGPAKIAAMPRDTVRKLLQQILSRQKSALTAQGPVTYTDNGDVKGTGVVVQVNADSSLKLLTVPKLKP